MSRQGPMWWKMKNGSEIYIPDMDDSHLVNSIRYLEKKFGTDQVENWPVYKNLWNEMREREIDYARAEWDN